jgi:hypothetical protein
VLDLEPEHCELGALTNGVRGQEGFVFWFEGGVVGAGESKGAWLPLEGPACRENLSHERYTARLDGEGTLRARLEACHSGDQAERWERRKLGASPSDFNALLRWAVGSVSPLARESEGRWDVCAHRSGECGFGVTLVSPRYASRNGSRWLVPLSLSRQGFEDLQRFEWKHDSYVPAPAGIDLEELEVPAGFHAVNLPDAVPGLAIRLTAERTPKGVKLTRCATLTRGSSRREHLARLGPLVERVHAWRKTVLVSEPN